MDARRSAAGLPPLAENIARIRKQVAAERQPMPEDIAENRHKAEEWARSVGWRD